MLFGDDPAFSNGGLDGGESIIAAQEFLDGNRLRVLAFVHLVAVKKHPMIAQWSTFLGYEACGD